MEEIDLGGEIKEKIRKESYLIYSIGELIKYSFSKADFSDDVKKNRFLWKIEDSDNYFFYSYEENRFGTVDIDIVHSTAFDKFLGHTSVPGEDLERIKEFIQDIKIYIDSMRCMECKTILECSRTIVMGASFFYCPKCHKKYVIYGGKNGSHILEPYSLKK